MTGILDKFHAEHGPQGARAVGHASQLTGYCTTDEEVDEAIQMLKDDLDACGKAMKRLLKVNRSGALFEGWPSTRDNVVDA